MPGSGRGSLRHARRDEVKIPFSRPKSRFRLYRALWSEMRTRIGLLIFGTAFEARAGDGGVELWWVPPTHISAQGEPKFENSRLVGAVTGVFEVSYPEDEDLSEDEVRKQMKYEVEVSIADADTRGFFGFTSKKATHFEIAAESLWELADGWVLATAYELFFYVTYGEWGHPMLVSERRQQIGAMVLRAVRKHNSGFEPSSK